MKKVEVANAFRSDGNYWIPIAWELERTVPYPNSRPMPRISERQAHFALDLKG